MISAFKDLIATNIGVVLLGIVIILVIFVEFLKIVKYIKDYFGIKTKQDTQREETEERENDLETRLDNLEGNLNELKANQETIKNESIAGDKELSGKIDELKEILLEDKKRSDAQIVASFREKLYSLHRELTAQGWIDLEGLKTITELGKIYEDAGGDDIWHDRLKPELLALPIKQNNN